MGAGGLRRVPKLMCMALEEQGAGGEFRVSEEVTSSTCGCFEGSKGLAEPVGPAGVCGRAPKALPLL